MNHCFLILFFCYLYFYIPLSYNSLSRFFFSLMNLCLLAICVETVPFLSPSAFLVTASSYFWVLIACSYPIRVWENLILSLLVCITMRLSTVFLAVFLSLSHSVPWASSAAVCTLVFFLSFLITCASQTWSVWCSPCYQIINQYAEQHIWLWKSTDSAFPQWRVLPNCCVLLAVF